MAARATYHVWYESGDLTEVYRCPGCNCWRPYCDGCHDDLPDVCDRCWALAHSSLWHRFLVWIGLSSESGHWCSSCHISSQTIVHAHADDTDDGDY